MKIGPGVSELWGVENRPLPLTRPMAYTTACTTVQAVIYTLLQLATAYTPKRIFPKKYLKDVIPTKIVPFGGPDDHS